MTDKELSPEQAEAVRRLLAEARHDEPMPDGVGRRLDNVIARLAAERAAGEAGEPRDATVVPLHRRRWPRVLVAAAAVSAIGLGVTQVVGGVGGAGDDSGAANSETALLDDSVPGPASAGGDDPANSLGEPGEPEAPRPDNGDTAAEARDDRHSSDWRGYLKHDGIPADALVELSAQLGAANFGRLQPLDRSRLPEALREMVRASASPPWDGALSSNLDVTNQSAYDAGIAPRECGPIYTVAGGKATYARYQKKLALVLFHPEINGAQLVELYVCSGKSPRRSVERVTLWDGE